MKHSPDALHTALAATPKKTQDYGTDPTGCLALTVAIHLDDQALDTRLLKLGANPWISSHLFGSDAFHLTTRLKARQLLRTLLSATSTNHSDVAAKRRSGIICKCTHLALSDKDSNMAIELFSWHIQHLGKPSGGCSSVLVHCAAATDALTFVQTMQTSGYLDPKRSPHTQEIIKGLLDNPQPQAMLDHFETNGFLNVYSRYRPNPNDQAQRLIDLAVHHSCVPLAKAVFALAHYVDTENGLREAISKNELSMVQLFLKNGADPEATRWCERAKYHRSTCELARPGSKVYKIVREAVQKKVRTLGNRYSPPVFSVWDMKKQMDVPVAYTFHAPEL